MSLNFFSMASVVPNAGMITTSSLVSDEKGHGVGVADVTALEHWRDREEAAREDKSDDHEHDGHLDQGKTERGNKTSQHQEFNPRL